MSHTAVRARVILVSVELALGQAQPLQHQHEGLTEIEDAGSNYLITECRQGSLGNRTHGRMQVRMQKADVASLLHASEPAQIQVCMICMQEHKLAGSSEIKYACFVVAAAEAKGCMTRSLL